MDHPASSAGTASTGKLAILIDGACDMCRTGAEAVRHYDESKVIEIFDLQGMTDGKVKVGDAAVGLQHRRKDFVEIRYSHGLFFGSIHRRLLQELATLMVRGVTVPHKPVQTDHLCV